MAAMCKFRAMRWLFRKLIAVAEVEVIRGIIEWMPEQVRLAVVGAMTTTIAFVATTLSGLIELNWRGMLAIAIVIVPMYGVASYILWRKGSATREVKTLASQVVQQQITLNELTARSSTTHPTDPFAELVDVSLRLNIVMFDRYASLSFVDKPPYGAKDVATIVRWVEQAKRQPNRKKRSVSRSRLGSVLQTMHDDIAPFEYQVKTCARNAALAELANVDACVLDHGGDQEVMRAKLEEVHGKYDQFAQLLEGIEFARGIVDENANVFFGAPWRKLRAAHRRLRNRMEFIMEGYAVFIQASQTAIDRLTAACVASEGQEE